MVTYLCSKTSNHYISKPPMHCQRKLTLVLAWGWCLVSNW